MTLGERVNALLDDLHAVADRLLEFPGYAVMLGAAAVLALLAVVAIRLLHRPGRTWVGPCAWTVAGLLLAAVVTTASDRRVAGLEGELQQLRARLDAAVLAAAARNGEAAAAPTAPSRPASAAPPAPATAPAPQRALLLDRARCEHEFEAVFGEFEWQPTVLSAAIDYAPIRFKQPLVRAHLAVVDLTAPGLTVELGTDRTKKTLTSDFARERHCDLAINGEAGMSPFPDSGLGYWTGVLVDAGKVLQTETKDNPRPYLSLRRDGRAKLITQLAKERAVPADCWWAIWGRWDALLGGEVQFPDVESRQPRTAMGVDRTGTRLFLLVVDGRQNRYSIGFTAAEVGMLLRIVGAYDAMLCDEGGSSCMVVAALGGVVNSPSDGGGRERSTYTHFGLRIEGASRR